MNLKGIHGTQTGAKQSEPSGLLRTNECISFVPEIRVAEELPAQHAAADDRQHAKHNGERTQRCRGFSEGGHPAIQQWIIQRHMSALPQAVDHLRQRHLRRQPAGCLIKPQ